MKRTDGDRVPCKQCGKSLKNTPANLRQHTRTRHGPAARRKSRRRIAGLELLINGGVATTFKQVTDGLAALQEAWTQIEGETRELRRQVASQSSFLQKLDAALAQARKERLEEIHNPVGDRS